MSDRHNGVAWRVPHKGGKACADALSTGYLCAASPAGEAENGRRTSGQDLGQNSLKSLAGLARWSGLADGDLVRLGG